jgi:pimeloyl-ACP methyl ester carboxylesterase
MLSKGSPPIGYEDRGAGAPIVLLHPFPLSRDSWAGLSEALAARHRVIAIDARGFGETPPSARFSIADLADDVATLLTELGLERAALLGMSMGGYTALAFAARHPRRLAALALCDTRAAADSSDVRAARAAAIDVIRDAGPTAYLVASLPRLLSPGAPAALANELRARAETRAASLIAGIEALRDRPDRSGELDAIRCPTLLVCGEADQVTPVAEMRGMAEAISGSTFTVVPEAGHLCHVEAPEAFERALAPFEGWVTASSSGAAAARSSEGRWS